MANVLAMLRRSGDRARERAAMRRIRSARPDREWSLRTFATHTVPGRKCRALAYRTPGAPGWLWFAWAESADALDHAVRRLTGGE